MSLTFTSWSFDAASYAPGAAITLTVSYQSTDEVTTAEVANAVTVALTSDASGTVSQSSDDSGNFPSFTTPGTPGGAAPVTVSASDARGDVWTVFSNSFADGGPPFAGTAVLTSVA